MAALFSVEHFEGWARRLVLDSGESWRLEPYQLDFVEDVFGGRPENWQVVPEGNGKTTLIGGLGSYALRFAEDANIPIAASTRDQAKIMYRQAKGLLRRSSLLGPENADEDGFWFEAFDGYRRIDLRTSGRTKRGEVVGFMEVHAADSGSGDGVIPYPFAILDELHRHKNLELYRTWLGKHQKRGGRVIAISTAGAPGSEFEETRMAIRSRGQQERRSRTFLRVVGPGLVLHEHAVPEDADVNDLELVAEANPFSGITVQTLTEKRASLTMTDAHWRRFTCNIAAQTEAELFIDPAAWKACGPAEGEEPVLFPDEGEVCVGADGSRTWDTTVLARAALGERIDVACKVFSVRRDAPHHVLHEGGKVDFDDVEASLLDLFDRYEVVATAYDPRYLERSMEIVDARLPESWIVAVEPQSKAARDAYQALFTAVIEGRLRHDGDPVIAAHLANCAVERDDRNQEIRRLRKIDPRKPIDAVPALAFAVWQAQTRVPAGGELMVAAA
jgi:phage terminase large subunit-like protein